MERPLCKGNSLMENCFRQWGIPLFLSVKALRSGIYKCLQREFRVKKDLRRESPNQNQRLVWKTPQTPKTQKPKGKPTKQKRTNNGQNQKTKTPKLNFLFFVFLFCRLFCVFCFFGFPMGFCVLSFLIKDLPYKQVCRGISLY